ncbi:penicillin-binding protein 1C [Commensalibacter oyaizuii]|uniref:peptidoglycan glycosyltransferase n=1 Tax=Commensalibacter oyaizuii TaxID=3043873 RepID=A0ABT6PYM5_9PROT|nr:penicillin-binding protein 1C [Commensalibacter sp. TBRC 16381]MDI2089960.1 penicillin-binding protein 1C [Commensalibacter sp. TBRC 16381]
MLGLNAWPILRFIQKWQNWICAVGLVFLLIMGCRLYPHPSLRNSLPVSRMVYDQNGKLLRLTLAKDDRYRLWVPLNQISPNFIAAVQFHEDQWFYYHFGVNPYGILRGAWMTYVRHGNRQGGSTITMQLARLLYQLSTKTPLGKIKQIYYATQLELFYSKSDILEAYLNLAPYGGNIEGIETASLIYFNKKASTLNLPEALLLAVIPQEPNLRIRCHQNKDCFVTNKHLLQTRMRLYQDWVKYNPKLLNQQTFINLPLPVRPPSQLPFEAPHFVRQVLASYPSPVILKTTLDLTFQHILENQIKSYINWHKKEGVTNAAALLIDAHDMGIKAMVGSADYFNSQIHGQINGTQISRSPGSSLKPFVYGLGFDQGILHPQSILYDMPMTFAGYSPENFDLHFQGPITATNALNTSRNIPAVWIAYKIKNPDFYQFLAKANIKNLRNRQHYGLSLVLGGGEITLQEEATLYALLNHQGKLRPLRFLISDPVVDGKPLLSNAARFMVLDILSKNSRPDERTSAISSPFPIAWKTGTSSGFRDALTAGLFSHYVLIVWVGNFDNTANSNATGIKTAAPLFFNIIDALKPNLKNIDITPWHPPKLLKKVKICLTSGNLPNRWCPQTGYTWFIPGVSPIQISTLHRPVLIDDTTGKVACPPLEGKKTHIEIFEFWPSEIRQLFKIAGLSYRDPPGNYHCQKSWIGNNPPRILSPHAHETYFLRTTTTKKNTSIPLSANSSADAHTLYWFANKIYLGKTDTSTTLFWHPAVAGQYQIKVIDDQAQSHQIPINIEITH